MPFSEIQPQIATTRVLSATDMYTFDPTDAVWAAGTVTFTQADHGLGTPGVNGGTTSVNIACGNTALGWNIGTVTATKVDDNTFTVPLVTDPGTFPNTHPYPNDSTGYVTSRVTVSVPSMSKTFYLADYWQMDTLGGATSVQLQAKLNESAVWTNVGTAVTTLGLATFSPSYNFMRFVVTGAGSPVIYTQKNYYPK